MKYLFPLINELTVDISSSSLLFDCVFFSDFDSAFYDSSHKFVLLLWMTIYILG